MRLLIIFLLLFFYTNSHADYYVAPMQSANWKLMTSQMSCQLRQDIPYYGSADFFQRAGGVLQFSIQEQRNKPKIVKASLTVVPAPWIHEAVDRAEYEVFLDDAIDLKQQGRLAVYGEVAESMVDALVRGQYPTFMYVRESKRAPVEETRVAVSSIKFSEVYDSFLNCRANLLPFAFNDIQNSRIYFNTRSKFLNRKAKQNLHQIADYLNKMPESKAYIGSDTSNLGMPDKKWFELRAGVIKQQLLNEGVDSTRIDVEHIFPVGISDQDVRISILAPDPLRKYMFRKGSLRLSPMERKRLDLLAEYIKEFFTQGSVLIRSYTDSQGTRKSNLNVSRRRGDVLKAYLEKRGVPISRIKVKAYGEDRPIKSNRFEIGRAQNRRVVIDLLN